MAALRTYLATRQRINQLIDQYLPLELLSDRLADLPTQFTTPHQRPWEPIDWKKVDRQQIIHIEPEFFLQVLASAAEIEDPIRSYASESWHYLHPLQPDMANFMGGEFSAEGQRIRVGTWEKEERQHSPIFRKLYEKLTDHSLEIRPNSVSGYQPNGTPQEDLHRHISDRITSEWSATGTYLWLMAHSTGELQRILAQPLQDEINHLAKFWGFSRWLYADRFWTVIRTTLTALLTYTHHHRQERSTSDRLFNPQQLLVSFMPTIALGFTLSRLLVRLRQWDRELSSSYLRHLFGASPVLTESPALAE